MLLAGSSVPPVWLFGYGSLLWRPGFDHLERVRGYVQGWSRRFWQGSTDHRGLPGAPGRVVTLERVAAEGCWGVAYRLEPKVLDATLRALDVREQGGYERHVVEFHCRDGTRSESWPALLYVAGPENPEYLGPAPLEQIARQVLRAAGPSGTNLEYVLELQAALGALGIADPHVAELAALVSSAIAAPAVQEARAPEPESHAQPRAGAAGLRAGHGEAEG